MQANPTLPHCISKTSQAEMSGRAKASPADDWTRFDAPEAVSRFTDPMAGTAVDAGATAGERVSHVRVEGMHCAACATLIESWLMMLPGIHAVQVNAASARARVVWDPKLLHPSQWLERMMRIGYRPVPFEAEDEQALQRREQRRMLWRWLVAGFCMMQVMMYAWPVYVAAPGEMTPDMVSLMRWASWVLTLPVLLFSCGPFFRSAWRDIRQWRIGMDVPVSLGILIAFGVSSAVTFDASGRWGQEVYFDSLTMWVFFLLSGRWLELRLRLRTAGALHRLMEALPTHVRVLQSNGQWALKALEDVRPGQTVQVLSGEMFACDGRLTQGQSLCDEAMLTGESTARWRGVGERVLAGSFNRGATVEMEVMALGSDTRRAQILSLVQQAASCKPVGMALADRIAPLFVWGVLAAAAWAGWWQADGDGGRAWMTVATVLIVTCPCALSLATPAALLAAAGAWARAGVLVRDLQSIETWAKVRHIVFDKTGTLTLDRLDVARIDTADAVGPSQALGWAAALAAHSLHPVARGLVAAHAHEAPAAVASLALHDVHETPGLGVQATDSMGRVWRLGSAEFCGVPSGGSMAAPEVVLCADGQWCATFVLQEELRADARHTVVAFSAQGVQTHLLSGDRCQAVEQVAHGMPWDSVSGEQSPQDKLHQLQALQQRDEGVVAMVGDGLNDAPVLAAAHVSVSLAGAVPLSREKSDIVVLGDGLGVLPATHLHARKTMRIIAQNMAWALLYNLVCIPLAMGGWLPAWLAGLGMATSSLLVLLNSARLVRL
jgi:P-type Cu2+ transporter